MIQDTLETGQKYSTDPGVQTGEQTSKRMSAAERASDASSAERVNKPCERTSGWPNVNVPQWVETE